MTGNQTTNYQEEGGPNATEYFAKKDSLLFTNVTRTDFQWAIPDRVLLNPKDSNKDKK